MLEGVCEQPTEIQITRGQLKGNGDQQSQRHREDKAWTRHRKNKAVDRNLELPAREQKEVNLERETGCRLWKALQSD